ncbi:MAG: carboxypeptidase-like regulatory domain-containing protein [Alcanivorax sp.]|nr:carboxypeptidase-like regulatory domain-containing protein [Alcanivorax sp.]
MSGSNWRAMCLTLLSASVLLAGCIPMVQRLSDSPPVTGQVLDARTGEPVAGVRVQALPRDLDPGPTTVSDARGHFSLPERDRLRLFMAMPGTALDHVLLAAVEESGDGDSSQRIGYGTATKWLRQPAPATEGRIVILMLPRHPGAPAGEGGNATAAPSCELMSENGSPQHDSPQHDYTFRILDMLPALLGSDWFRQQLSDDPDAGRRHAETLDYFARTALRECGGHPRSEAHREALQDYWDNLLADSA